MASRSYLSIGDVLTLLRREFPDITISKIRFLESQGLVNPERTPSGYRKFYDHDVERLRWVLVQQREHFLPLRVIKDRLESAGDGSLPPEDIPGDLADSGSPEERAQDPGMDGPVPARADVAPVGVGARAAVSREQARVQRAVSEPIAIVAEDEQVWIRRPAMPVGSAGRAARSAAQVGDDEPDRHDASSGPGTRPGGGEPGKPDVGASGARRGPLARSGDGPERGRSTAPEPVPGTGQSVQPRGPVSAPVAGTVRWMEAGDEASYTHDELAVASGLAPERVGDLRSHGLIAPEVIGGTELYDADALVVAQLAARFAAFGVEPRHLRLYRNAAEREAGFVEQVILPLVRQRNPDARAQARETSADLLRLGRELREVLVDRALRELLQRR